MEECEPGYIYTGVHVACFDVATGIDIRFISMTLISEHMRVYIYTPKSDNCNIFMTSAVYIYPTFCCTVDAKLNL